MGMILTYSGGNELPAPVLAWAEREEMPVLETHEVGETCGTLIQNPLCALLLIQVEQGDPSALRLSRSLAGDVLFGNLPRLAVSATLRKREVAEWMDTGIDQFLLLPCPEFRLMDELQKATRRRWRTRFFQPAPTVCARLRIYRDDYVARLTNLAVWLDSLCENVQPERPGVVFGSAKPLLVEIRKAAVEVGVPLIGQFVTALIVAAPRKDGCEFPLALARLAAMAQIVREQAASVPGVPGWEADAEDMRQFRERSRTGAADADAPHEATGQQAEATGTESTDGWSDDEEEDGDELYGDSVLPAFHSFALLSRFDDDFGDCSISDLAECVQQNSLLCAEVLAIANSSEVAALNPVDDVETAIHLIGVEQVQRLATSYRQTAAAHSRFTGFDWRLFWMHQMGCADLAREAATLLNVHRRQEIYAMALLHDLGKVLLSNRNPQEYRKAVATALKTNGNLSEAERSVLGIDHSEAGLRYARRQGLPEALAVAMACHENPESAPERYVEELAIVSLANFLCKKHRVGFSGSVVREPHVELEEQPGWRWIATHLHPTFTAGDFEDKMKAAAIQTRYVLEKAVQEMRPNAA